LLDLAGPAADHCQLRSAEALGVARDHLYAAFVASPRRARQAVAA
jgi:hypothetical protein